MGDGDKKTGEKREGRKNENGKEERKGEVLQGGREEERGRRWAEGKRRVKWKEGKDDRTGKDRGRRGRTKQKDESHVPGKRGTEVEEGEQWLMKKGFNEQMRREKGTM